MFTIVAIPDILPIHGQINLDSANEFTKLGQCSHALHVYY